MFRVKIFRKMKMTNKCMNYIYMQNKDKDN